MVDMGRKLISSKTLCLYMVSSRCEEILTLTLTIFHVCSPTFIQNSHFPNIFIYCNIIVFLYFFEFPCTQSKWINKLIKRCIVVIREQKYSFCITSSVNCTSVKIYMKFQFKDRISKSSSWNGHTNNMGSELNAHFIFWNIFITYYPISLFETFFGLNIPFNKQRGVFTQEQPISLFKRLQKLNVPICFQEIFHSISQLTFRKCFRN